MPELMVAIASVEQSLLEMLAASDNGTISVEGILSGEGSATATTISGSALVLSVPNSPAQVYVPAAVVSQHSASRMVITEVVSNTFSGLFGSEGVSGNLLSVTLFDENGTEIEAVDFVEPITLTLESFETGTTSCVFWDEEEGTWSNSGLLKLEATSETYLTCNAYHMTLFGAIQGSDIGWVETETETLSAGWFWLHIFYGHSWLVQPATLFFWSILLLHVLLWVRGRAKCPGPWRLEKAAAWEVWSDDSSIARRGGFFQRWEDRVAKVCVCNAIAYQCQVNAADCKRFLQEEHPTPLMLGLPEAAVPTELEDFLKYGFCKRVWIYFLALQPWSKTRQLTHLKGLWVGTEFVAEPFVALAATSLLVQLLILCMSLDIRSVRAPTPGLLFVCVLLGLFAWALAAGIVRVAQAPAVAQRLQNRTAAPCVILCLVVCVLGTGILLSRISMKVGLYWLTVAATVEIWRALFLPLLTAVVLSFCVSHLLRQDSERPHELYEGLRTIKRPPPATPLPNLNLDKSPRNADEDPKMPRAWLDGLAESFCSSQALQRFEATCSGSPTSYSNFASGAVKEGFAPILCGAPSSQKLQAPQKSPARSRSRPRLPFLTSRLRLNTGHGASSSSVSPLNTDIHAVMPSLPSHNVLSPGASSLSPVGGAEIVISKVDSEKSIVLLRDWTFEEEDDDGEPSGGGPPVEPQKSDRSILPVGHINTDRSILPVGHINTDRSILLMPPPPPGQPHLPAPPPMAPFAPFGGPDARAPSMEPTQLQLQIPRDSPRDPIELPPLPAPPPPPPPPPPEDVEEVHIPCLERRLSTCSVSTELVPDSVDVEPLNGTNSMDSASSARRSPFHRSSVQHPSFQRSPAPPPSNTQPVEPPKSDLAPRPLPPPQQAALPSQRRDSFQRSVAPHLSFQASQAPQCGGSGSAISRAGAMMLSQPQTLMPERRSSFQRSQPRHSFHLSPSPGPQGGRESSSRESSPDAKASGGGGGGGGGAFQRSEAPHPSLLRSALPHPSFKRSEMPHASLMRAVSPQARDRRSLSPVATCQGSPHAAGPRALSPHATGQRLDVRHPSFKESEHSAEASIVAISRDPSKNRPASPASPGSAWQRSEMRHPSFNRSASPTAAASRRPASPDTQERKPSKWAVTRRESDLGLESELNVASPRWKNLMSSDDPLRRSDSPPLTSMSLTTELLPSASFQRRAMSPLDPAPPAGESGAPVPPPLDAPPEGVPVGLRGDPAPRVGVGAEPSGPRGELPKGTPLVAAEGAPPAPATGARPAPVPPPPASRAKRTGPPAAAGDAPTLASAPPVGARAAPVPPLLGVVGAAPLPPGGVRAVPAPPAASAQEGPAGAAAQQSEPAPAAASSNSARREPTKLVGMGGILAPSLAPQGPSLSMKGSAGQPRAAGAAGAASSSSSSMAMAHTEMPAAQALFKRPPPPSQRRNKAVRGLAAGPVAAAAAGGPVASESSPGPGPGHGVDQGLQVPKKMKRSEDLMLETMQRSRGRQSSPVPPPEPGELAAGASKLAETTMSVVPTNSVRERTPRRTEPEPERFDRRMKGAW